MWLKNKGVVVLCLLCVLMITSCSNNNDSKELVIFAASSLTEVVEDLKELYINEHEDIDISINLAGSNTLAKQIKNGAKADIFISANEKSCIQLEENDYIEKMEQIATNKMIIAVSNNSQVDIQQLEDLARPCSIVLANENVPAGIYAQEILHKLNKVYGDNYKENVIENVVSYESNVRQVMTKVSIGEADAAIVYVTDITDEVKEKVKLIEIPNENNILCTYWSAIIKQKNQSEELEQFYNLVLSDEGKEIFSKHGFNK